MIAPWKAEPPKELNKPVGCLQCRNSGFLGRAGDTTFSGLNHVEPVQQSQGLLLSRGIQFQKD